VQQAALWHDTVWDAIGAAVQAAGGVKKVAGHLWPTLDATSAAARLRAALNPEHAQKLGPDELLLVAELARQAGDHSLMSFFSRELAYDAPQPLDPEQAEKRVRTARRKALLEELMRLDDE
jgi:hypothetical protein